MKKIFIIIFTLSYLFAGGQILIPKKDYVPEAHHPRYSFAISLMPGAYGDVSYGIMRENPDSTREIIFLTKSSFVRQISGYEKSLANPDKINYPEKFGIDLHVLEDLWKLKDNTDFSGHQQGWGTKSGIPSKAQFEMLKEFGISRMSDYAYGDNLWNFLLKVSDPAWRGTYQLRSGE